MTPPKLTLKEMAKEKVGGLAYQLLGLSIDLVFAVAWLCANHLVSLAEGYFKPEGFNEKLWHIFHYIFAIATLITVLSFLIPDVSNIIKYMIKQLGHK